MKTYFLMTRLAPEVTAKMHERGKIGHAWLEQVRQKCPEVKFVGHYALLGPWDFIDIFEAPDEEVAAKVSMISRQYGAAQAESWTAIPYKRFVQLSEEI